MVWTAAVVAEESLRTVGVFSPYDDAPDPEDFDIALRRLDALVAFLVGVEKLHFFEEATQELTLEANKVSYNIGALLTTKLQYIENVSYTKDGGKPQPVELIRLSTFEDLKEEEPGSAIPERVYIERKDDGLLYPWGIPTVSGYKFIIRGRRFSDDMTIDGGSTPTDFSQAWGLCLVDLLAHNLGSGPVTDLPAAKLDRLLKEGERKKRMLIAYNQHENVDKPRYTRFNDF